MPGRSTACLAEAGTAARRSSSASAPIPRTCRSRTSSWKGFENRIAGAARQRLRGAAPTYVWWGQRQGFIRNTMNATLEEGRCDIVIGVPDRLRPGPHDDAVLPVHLCLRLPAGAGAPITSLDDPALKKLKIGVHLLGDDYDEPAAGARARQAATSSTTSSASARSTRRRTRRARSSTRWRSGKVDVAIVWGPVGGYFAARQHDAAAR